MSISCYGSENLESIIFLDLQRTSVVVPKKKLGLDNIPVKLLGAIVGYLSDQTGTPTFYNAKDLPFIIENVDNLASVNKALHEAVCGDVVTDALLLSLSHRFKMHPIDIAIQFKTKRTQAWFQKHLEKSDDYNIFLVVQNIFKICEQISHQTVYYKIDTKYSMDQDSRFAEEDQDSMFYKPISNTEQGLILDVGGKNRDEFILYTPWGQVRLFKKTSKSLDAHSVNLEAIAMQQALFEHITVSFDSIGDLLYKINGVQNQQLPDPTMASSKKYRSWNARKAIWQAMDNKFHERIPEVSLPQDKYEIKNVPVIYPTPYEEHPLISATSIHELIEKYAQLAARIIALPNYEHEDENDDYACKVLPCSNYEDTCILRDVTDMTNKLLPEKQQISFLTLGNDPDYNCHYVIAGQPVHQGLRLTTWYKNSLEEDNEVYAMWSLEFLQTHYQEVIDTFKAHWKKVNVIDYQKLDRFESEEAWWLLARPRFMGRDEYEFNSSLLRKLGLSKEQIYCTYSLDKAHSDTIFFWVKKDAMNDVQNILGLEISEESKKF